MVGGLITCGGVVRVQGAKVLSGSAQGIYPPHRGSWRRRAVGTARLSERWWGRRSSEWWCRRDQEQHLQRDDTCARNVGWMRTWANAVCDHVNKEKQSRDDDTNNKEERLKTNKLSCGSIHNVHESLMYSWVSSCFSSVYMLLCLSLCVPNSLVVTVPNLFTFWPVRESLVEIHTAKTDLWSVVFTPPVGCRRTPSTVNDLTATK